MHTLHKTEQLTDKQRNRLQASAMTQEQAVKHFFANEVAAFTVEDVYYSLRNARLISPKVPITSIRRTITNLSDNPKKNVFDGYLEKTTEVEEGEFGVNIHRWRRKVVITKQTELFQ
jgi:hypothetical protein